MQLVTTFIVCALFGFLVSRTVVPIFEKINQDVFIDYSKGMEFINAKSVRVADEVTSENKLDSLQEMIKDENDAMERKQNALKILVTDETGKVLYKTKYAEEEHINIHDKIRNVMNFSMNRPTFKSNSSELELARREFVTFYPITVEDKSLYMFVSGLPEGNVMYKTKEGPFPALIGVLVFIASFFYMTRRKMKQIEAMAQGVREIAKGDLTYRIEKQGQDELALLTENINHMAEEIMVNIERERKVEKQKNELITNVSHDLRTPLTSIMGYLRLLRDAKYENAGQYNEYIEIAFSKSEKLQSLIDDLFEYTKLTNEEMALEREEICLNGVLNQLIEELVPQAEEHGLLFVKEFPKESMYASVDSEKMVRVFDNLLMNAIKYSKDEGEIRVSLQREDDMIRISVTNQSEEFTKEELRNVFERFYKKDASRSRVYEGSGLGLAIAKSIVELHGGEIGADYKDGFVQFTILLPIE
ncbi:sensor histidine kinase [Bacillus badius]|nr:HAMP domain-containing sensor histidine kinase [Bacillus badius]KIL73930.1 sensor histidine kinase [Bacillus badius]